MEVELVPPAPPRPSRLRRVLGWLSLLWGAYGLISSPWRLAGYVSQPHWRFEGDLAWLVTYGLPPRLWPLVNGAGEVLAEVGLILAGLGLIRAHPRLARWGLAALLLPALSSAFSTLGAVALLAGSVIPRIDMHGPVPSRVTHLLALNLGVGWLVSASLLLGYYLWLWREVRRMTGRTRYAPAGSPTTAALHPDP